MHVHCPDPCCMTKAVLRAYVHATCPCPCCMSISMLHIHVNVHVHIYGNAGMLDCTVSSQSHTRLKRLMMPEQVRYLTKLTQSGIFLVMYRTKIQDAEILMLALYSSMLMPSYGTHPFIHLPSVPYYSTCL